LSEKKDDLTKQLKTLNQNIDTLTKVIAISIGKDNIFKGKNTIEEKVDVLDKMGLSNELIAIITGSKSSHSISQIKSRMNPTRPKDILTESKPETTEQEQVGKNDEQ
jgi:uncharacterized protein YegL